MELPPINKSIVILEDDDVVRETSVELISHLTRSDSNIEIKSYRNPTELNRFLDTEHERLRKESRQLFVILIT